MAGIERYKSVARQLIEQDHALCILGEVGKNRTRMVTYPDKPPGRWVKFKDWLAGAPGLGSLGYFRSTRESWDQYLSDVKRCETAASTAFTSFLTTMRETYGQALADLCIARANQSGGKHRHAHKNIKPVTESNAPACRWSADTQRTRLSLRRHKTEKARRAEKSSEHAV